MEALKALQDWSKWLVGINAGVLGLLSFSVQHSVKKYTPAPTNSTLTPANLPPETANPNLEPTNPLGNYDEIGIIVAICSFGLSLLVATWLVGSLPGFTQLLKTNSDPGKVIKWKGKNSIYQFKYCYIFPLSVFSTAQHLFFAVGVIALVLSLCLKVLH